MIAFLHHYLCHKSFISICIIVFCITLLIGIVDYLLGPEISTTILYFIPIVIAAWYGSKTMGLLTSFSAAFIWLITDIGSGREYSHIATYGWNTGMRLGIFIFITLLLVKLHRSLNAEETAADTDELTGALNARGFKERLSEEYARSTRSGAAFSLAFIDVDNFKTVNDTLGHSSGDLLLISIVKSINESLRKTDHLARLGGDEFVILFSETDDSIVVPAFTHVHKRLMDLVAENNWPVTFSVGIVSYDALPASPAHAIKIADEIMYGVKKSTKNNVIYKTWRGSE